MALVQFLIFVLVKVPILILILVNVFVLVLVLVMFPIFSSLCHYIGPVSILSPCDGSTLDYCSGPCLSPCLGPCPVCNLGSSAGTSLESCSVILTVFVLVFIPHQAPSWDLF